MQLESTPHNPSSSNMKSAPSSWVQHYVVRLGLKIYLPADWRSDGEDIPTFIHERSQSVIAFTKAWILGDNINRSLKEQLSDSASVVRSNHPALSVSVQPKRINTASIEGGVIEFEGAFAGDKQKMHMSMFCTQSRVTDQATGKLLATGFFDIFLYATPAEFAANSEHYRSIFERIEKQPLHGRMDSKTNQMVLEIESDQFRQAQKPPMPTAVFKLHDPSDPVDSEDVFTWTRV
jgi:hypothetical protein